MNYRSNESAYDLFSKANQVKHDKLIQWESEGSIKDPNFIKSDCLYYMKVFREQLEYEEGVFDLLHELFGSDNDDNYKIAEQILRNVKLKE